MNTVSNSTSTLKNFPLENAILVALGFSSLFMYGHWAIAEVGSVLSMHSWFNYPGMQAVTLVLLGILLLRWKPSLTVTPIDVIAAGFMAFAALGFGLLQESSPLFVSFVILASFAQTWLQMKWWSYYVVVDIKELVLGMCFGMVVIGLLKIAMAFFPNWFYVVGALLPWVTFWSLRSISKSSDETGQFSKPSDEQFRSLKTERSVWFDRKTTLSLWRMMVAVAVFLGLWALVNAIGKASSGHYGFGLTASPELLIGAQAIDIGFALALAWWVYCHKGTINYQMLWRFAYMCMAASLLYLICFRMGQMVQLFSSAAFVIAMVLIDIAAASIAQHSRYQAFYVFASFDLIYQVLDGAARGAVNMFDVVSFSPSVAAVLMFVSMLMVAFFLPDRTMGARYLLSDLNSVAPRLADHDQLDARCEVIAAQQGLSARELEIMQYLCRGRSKPYIAEALFLSENTIGTYTRRLYQKLNVHSKQELLSLVLEPGE